MHTHIIAKLPNCILSCLQNCITAYLYTLKTAYLHTYALANSNTCILANLHTYILAYLHASNTITSHLAIQQDHAISKLFGLHFDGHVRVLQELSLLKNCAIKIKPRLISETRKLAPFPYFRFKPRYFSHTSQIINLVICVW